MNNLRMKLEFEYSGIPMMPRFNGAGPFYFYTDINNKTFPLDFMDYYHSITRIVDTDRKAYSIYDINNTGWMGRVHELEDCYNDQYIDLGIDNGIVTAEWMREHIIGLESVGISITDNLKDFIKKYSFRLKSLKFEDESGEFELSEDMINKFNKRLSDDYGSKTLYYEE